MNQVRVTVPGCCSSGFLFLFQSEDAVQQSEPTMERLAEQHDQVAEPLASDAQAEIYVSALGVLECGHTFEEDLHCLDVNPNL